MRPASWPAIERTHRRKLIYGLEWMRVNCGGISMATPSNMPAQFGRYRVLKHLGRGGMGEVYFAQDTQLDRSVALKVAHGGSAGPEGLERFLREARLAA